MNFVSHNSHCALLSLELNAVHAVVGNILHDSGQHGPIAELVRDLDECGHILSWDGSADIVALLSVSKLSVILAFGLGQTGRKPELNFNS